MDTFNVDANMFLFYLCGYFAGGVMAFFCQNSNSKRYLPFEASIIEYLTYFLVILICDHFVIDTTTLLCCGVVLLCGWVVTFIFSKIFFRLLFFYTAGSGNRV